MVPVSALPTESLGHGDTVLLLCPVFDPDDKTACVDLLTPTDPQGENVLSVTITQSPRTRMAIWERHVETPPADGSIIVFDQSANELSVEGSVDTGNVSLLSAEDISDLGVRITEHLERWSEDGRWTVACFHSVSILLELVGRDEGIQFLRALAERCRAADATAHYHMDPRAHSAETVARLRNVFDIVYEHDGETWERTRP